MLHLKIYVQDDKWQFKHEENLKDDYLMNMQIFIYQ